MSGKVRHNMHTRDQTWWNTHQSDGGSSPALDIFPHQRLCGTKPDTDDVSSYSESVRNDCQATELVFTNEQGDIEGVMLGQRSSNGSTASGCNRPKVCSYNSDLDTKNHFDGVSSFTLASGQDNVIGNSHFDSVYVQEASGLLPDDSFMEGCCYLIGDADVSYGNVSDDHVSNYDCIDVAIDDTCDTNVTYVSNVLEHDSLSYIRFCDMNTRLGSEHYIGPVKSQMNLSCWKYYLQFEPDIDTRDYLFNGIANGFDIVDEGVDIPTYKCVNYNSVFSLTAFEFVSNQILKELADGKYIRANFVPHCVHALGVVGKSDGSYRIITDCKRPIGDSINNYMDTTFHNFSYSTVDQAASLIKQGMFMATVDISSAYRSIPVHPDQWTFQGVSWPLHDNTQGYYLDTHLCYGLRCAPYIFTKISDFIANTMVRLGFGPVINYLDDFLVYGETFESCQAAQTALIVLLGQLGFRVSWKKCSSPSTNVRYLGIIFDSVDFSLKLPEDKLGKLYSELMFFKDRTRATKKQIQRLCGILSHCSKVVRGGRTFSHRVIELLRGLPYGNPRIRLSNEFRLDIQWWISFARTFNGKEHLIHPNFGDGPILHTDSSLLGYGLVYENDWQAGCFNALNNPSFIECLDQSHEHWVNMDPPVGESINYLELIPVYQALIRYALIWQNQHVLLFSDNTQVVAMINKGISDSKASMALLRDMFWICASNNIYLTARHIPGELNVLPDMLSRLSDNKFSSSFAMSSLCCSGTGRS